jgi:hypothetical protein
MLADDYTEYNNTQFPYFVWTTTQDMVTQAYFSQKICNLEPMRHHLSLIAPLQLSNNVYSHVHWRIYSILGMPCVFSFFPDSKHHFTDISIASFSGTSGW